VRRIVARIHPRKLVDAADFIALRFAGHLHVMRLIRDTHSSDVECMESMRHADCEHPAKSAIGLVK
jgi:hypothetical protein